MISEFGFMISDFGIGISDLIQLQLSFRNRKSEIRNIRISEFEDIL